MRKILPYLCVFALLLLSASPLYAGAIVNKSNQSADYFRTLARNAGTDYADIIVYNPAGTMKMEDGAYVKLDLMYIAKDYSNTISPAVPTLGGPIGELSQDEPSIVPGFFSLYKSGKWSGFFAFTIPGGGGEIDFTRGDATTVGFTANATGLGDLAPQSSKGESIYYGYTLGGAFAFNDVWSLAAGVRYIDAFKEQTLSVTLGPPGTPATVVDFKQDADGWSGFLGVNIAPSEELNIGLTYFHKTELDFKTDLKQDGTGGAIGTVVPFLNQGAMLQEDLPGQINAGVSYKFTPQLRVESDLTYYLEKEATWQGRLDGQGNSWEWSLMGEWTFNPQWKASLGYLHSEIDVDQNRILPQAPELTANTIGGGAVWSITPSWDLTFGAVKVWYDSKTSTANSSFTFAPAGTNYEKDVWSVFTGLQWKFL